MAILCVDFGSTFTKAALIDADTGALLGRHSVPTTIGTDVLDGYHQITGHLHERGHAMPGRTGAGEVSTDGSQVLACSSAGGGLRLAVVGHEQEVSAEAGHRVGLSAGARVVHVTAGSMTVADVASLRAARPDVILLVGGTDGGNAEVLRHNADRLARSRVGPPVVVAGNAAVADEVSSALSATGRRHVVTANVLPRIGVIAPEGARAAIREVFLAHVIGGKGLSRGSAFTDMVRAATPDAMLRGVEVLAEAVGGDVLVLDVGGATTDVYSVVTPEGEDAGLRKDVVAPLWYARTVEGDLGVRWNAPGVLDAARAENLERGVDRAELTRWVQQVHQDTGRVPHDDRERRLDLELARLAALTAVRRHGRPSAPGGAARPLINVAHVLGSGGVLRHADPYRADEVLAAVLTDHGGGWAVPRDARRGVGTAYLLFAAGLLAPERPRLAAKVARRVGGAAGDDVGGAGIGRHGAR